MEACYSIFQVSKWFLKKDSMTLKRLQKLCYYAQAWFYTLKDKKLADTEFQAWAHGPVSYDLWNELKSKYYGISVMYDYTTEDLPCCDDIVDPDDVELLEMVWNTYGDQSGTALEALTHTEDPWIKARGTCRDNEKCSNEISLDSMKEYYRRIYSGEYGE